MYAHGRAGMMIALNANTGEVLWSRDFLKEYHADFGCCGASTPATIEGLTIEEGANISRAQAVESTSRMRARSSATA